MLQNYLAPDQETQTFMLSTPSGSGEGRGAPAAGVCCILCRGAPWGRPPPAEVNSPIPGLLPLHPQLLGSWQGEEKLSTVGISSPTHKHCSPGNQPGRRKTGCTSVARSAPPHPASPGLRRGRRKNWWRLPGPREVSQNSTSHRVVGVKLEKKKKKHTLYPKLNGMKEKTTWV